MGPRSKAALAGIVALVAAFAIKGIPWIGGFVGAKLFVERMFSPSSPSLAELEVELQRQGFTTFAAIKEELPSDYEQLMRQLTTIVAENDGEAAFQQGFALVAELRRKYAPNLRNAPRQDLSALLRANLDLLKLVQRKESDALCSQFALKGPIVLAKKGRTYLKPFNDVSATMIRTIGASIRKPVPVAPASDADWGEIMDSFIGTDEQLQLVANETATDPDYCRALIAFFETVVMAEGPAAERVRAEIASTMAAN
jgi:hypothetical protein